MSNETFRATLLFVTLSFFGMPIAFDVNQHLVTQSMIATLAVLVYFGGIE